MPEEKTMPEDKSPTMLYSLENLGGGKKAVVDRKQVSCYTLITEDVEVAKKAGWTDLKGLIDAYENPVVKEEPKDEQAATDDAEKEIEGDVVPKDEQATTDHEPEKTESQKSPAPKKLGRPKKAEQ